MMRADRRLRIGVALVATVVALTGCTIQVPSGTNGTQQPSASAGDNAPERSAVPSSSATELPPQTVAQIREKDMTFERGAYLEGSDGLSVANAVTEAPGWKQTTDLVNGESAFVSQGGCEATFSYTSEQDPLVVEGDDRASTLALFRYQDPSILDEQLKETTWLWGTSPKEAGASIEFLTYEQRASVKSPASMVSLRLFAGTQTAIAFTVACPSDDQLERAVSDFRGRVSVVPPDSQ